MLRKILSAFLIMIALSPSVTESCPVTYVDASLTMDDPLTENWCHLAKSVDDFWYGLSLDEESDFWWPIYTDIQGSNLCDPYGTLSRLFNAAWMLYGIQWYRDNITLYQPTRDWGAYVFDKSDDSYLADCSEEANATNFDYWIFGGPTYLHANFWRVSVPYRAATLVHEATHEDISHVSLASLCWTSTLCYQEMSPYWPGACGSSVDIGFGMRQDHQNAQSMGIYFMHEVLDTFLKDPDTKELLIKQYSDTECGYVHFLSQHAFDEVHDSIISRYQNCFLITPDDPVRSDKWIEFFKEASYGINDYSYVLSNYMKPPAWNQTWPCAGPCMSQDYLPGGKFSCKEQYQPENKAINEYNSNLCQAASAEVSEGATATKIAQVTKKFKEDRKQCLSGVSDAYLKKRCSQAIAQASDLADLETEFKLDDDLMTLIPDSVFETCEQNYCEAKFDSAWVQPARTACYEWDDPHGCTERFCGKLSNFQVDSLEYFDSVQCRKKYFENSGKTWSTGASYAGKCKEEYMECVREKELQAAYQVWLDGRTADQCSLTDTWSPYQYEALDLIGSGATYQDFIASHPDAKLGQCEGRFVGCSSLMKKLGAAMAELLELTEVPREAPLEDFGLPAPGSGPDIRPVERSLKVLAEKIAHPTGSKAALEQKIRQLVMLPEYQHAVAKALGIEAYFSLMGTKGLNKIFPRGILSLHNKAALRFDITLNPAQQAMLPALMEISETRKRIEAPETLLLLESLGSSKPQEMFALLQSVGGARSVSEINAALDGISVAPVNAPLAPVLLSPVNAATGVSANCSLAWNASAGAMFYRLQISTKRDFSEIISDLSDIAGTSMTASLAVGITYYWRANARNNVGLSDWSQVWSFNTGSSAPTAPTPVSPNNEATNISTSPTFTWNPSSGATGYRLQVATDSAFETLVYDESGIAAASQSVTGLHGGRLHYWRCNASNSTGTSSWSEVWSFTTGR